MALPLSIPDSPSAGSPASTDGSNGPQTPVSPNNSVHTLALPAADGSTAPAAPISNNSAAAQNKRKPSRRANTAERRATHNAVERARRETLNGRFLDLAALLPNLSQIRRPSKSSIVNSSIAHIHAARRHRLLAARELRIVKLESDALRRELNEWRDRSGLPRVEEPVRGEAFQMILSGEVEVINAGPMEEDDGEDYGDDDYAGPPTAVPIMHDNDMDGPIHKGDIHNPFAHSVPQPRAGGNGLQLQTILPRPTNGHGPHTPMVVHSPTGVSFENPAMSALYEPHPHHIQPQYSGGQYMSQQGQVMGGHVHDDKWGSAQMFNAQVPGGPALFTPPASSHGAGNVSPMNVGGPQQQQQAQQQQAFLMNFQRQQMMQQQQMDGHANSGPVRRERSGSVNSNGSGYASPVSNPGSSYEMPSAMNGPAAIPRRMGQGWDDGMNMAMGGMPGMGMMKGAPISVGGGGNNHGYASMML
ncbi:uncharacterized protein TRAVEDRAFT_54312 [Trametes versicolor FP-101664 SS1]|uniref:BHLH domain-containing protein n=1 Tax=Trametes versicolor (strain FP-101664) TaxID=717944 RepID=R7S864_TRAVS|nr:uncharacterized protein TRAVEDRAFT_54312 [Trametes versicolor FP-101664 SS1]EIW51895.1 hypothetical protein TRAVEDRAFT_54312 [Trametes versicolor FP-101664 SS1]